MRKRVLIYPYNDEVNYILKYSEMLYDLEIKSLISPCGWYESNKKYDVGKKSILVEDNYNDFIEKDCDVVWFVDSKYNLDFEKYYLEEIKLAIENSKEIIISQELEDKLKKYNLSIERNRFKPSIIENKPEITETLVEINTPIICICSIFRSLSKFDIQLSMRKEFIKRNIKISQVGSRNDANLFGFHSIPKFMYSSEYTDSEKIILFNRFIKNIEVEENPEIIVIGIPGELSSVSNNFVVGFGLLALKLFLAISTDIAIVSLPYAEYKEKELEGICNYLKMRFGIDVDFINIVKKRFLIEESETEQDFVYLTLDNKNIKTNEYTYDLSELKEMERLIDNCLIKLESYGDLNLI